MLCCLGFSRRVLRTKLRAILLAGLVWARRRVEQVVGVEMQAWLCGFACVELQS